ncbi:restriction endonuclease subunit S [Colwellia sp. M166]|uniref:restriction endonuclease subunit S n=1 Tax=Colwellia sp. M166 TaxID=2583805 RepID=UPI00211E2C30|nr:restriction endonuclease subunit S [Colwellia sp. M166]UUO22462.1 restriction endonuclease subunit S [Colwellia sp. M166]|tara:strand:+ start:8749 stop:10170 length:1422 start_codon:yes stop_codon:yes gene_type:complete
MANKWKEVRLGDITSIRRGSSPRPIVNFITDEGMPWVKIADATGSDSKYITSTKQYLKQEGVCKSIIVEPGDLILSNSGTAGLPKFMGITACIHDGWQVFKDLDGISSEFLYYSLIYMRERLLHGAYDSTMKNLTLDMVRDAKIFLPELSEQDAVTDILSTLDKKIELNCQTNQTLEQMAQVLFKSWFVDFDPVFDNALASGMAINDFPGTLQNKALSRQQQRRQVQQQIANGELEATPLPEDIRQLFPSEFEQTDELSIGINGWIPKGWEVSELTEVTTELRRGISPKYTEEGGIQVINQKCIRNHEINFSLCRRNNPELRKVAGRELLIGDVLVNSTGVGTLGRVAQLHSLPEPTVVDSHVTVVRPNVEKVLIYTFGQLMLANERRIEALGEGSTGQTELSRKILSEQKVVLPPVNIATKIEDTFKSYADKQVNNRVQIASLEKLRDTLLPKLISGELQLPAESINAEVST